MTQFLILMLLSCVAMALTQAVLGAFFPSTHRPWWHPLKRETRPMSSATAAPQTALQLVETLDRRQTPMPFVGRDRRKAGRAEAGADQRRTGTRD
ncbi:hypothetical protein ACWA7J_17575 [Leptothrix sp. BB-4]